MHELIKAMLEASVHASARNSACNPRSVWYHGLTAVDETASYRQGELLPTRFPIGGGVQEMLQPSPSRRCDQAGAKAVLPLHAGLAGGPQRPFFRRARYERTY